MVWTGDRLSRETIPTLTRPSSRRHCRTRHVRRVAPLPATCPDSSFCLAPTTARYEGRGDGHSARPTPSRASCRRRRVLRTRNRSRRCPLSTSAWPVSRRRRRTENLAGAHTGCTIILRFSSSWLLRTRNGRPRPGQRTWAFPLTFHFAQMPQEPQSVRPNRLYDAEKESRCPWHRRCS